MKLNLTVPQSPFHPHFFAKCSNDRWHCLFFFFIVQAIDSKWPQEVQFYDNRWCCLGFFFILFIFLISTVNRWNKREKEKWKT